MLIMVSAFSSVRLEWWFSSVVISFYQLRFLGLCFLAWCRSGMSNNWFLISSRRVFCGSAWVRVLVLKFCAGLVQVVHF